MTDSSSKQKHFVLVHGGCHGAWSWYKLKPLLENAGHHVTTFDMAASGINLKKIEELDTILDYSEPLIQFMESLPDDHKVILVGHSFGGFNLAVAMERFPHKIEVAVFLTAFMPFIEHTPSFIFDKFMEINPKARKFWLDTEFDSGDPKKIHTTYIMGTKFLTQMYHLSPLEDLELAKMLVRRSSLFLHDLSKPESKLSKDKYGSVRRVYVICDKDQAINLAFQRWMIENEKVEAKELKDSDHMPMFCMPTKLCVCLLELASA